MIFIGHGHDSSSAQSKGTFMPACSQRLHSALPLFQFRPNRGVPSEAVNLAELATLSLPSTLLVRQSRIHFSTASRHAMSRGSKSCITAHAVLPPLECQGAEVSALQARQMSHLQYSYRSATTLTLPGALIPHYLSPGSVAILSSE